MKPQGDRPSDDENAAGECCVRLTVPGATLDRMKRAADLFEEGSRIFRDLSETLDQVSGSEVMAISTCQNPGDEDAHWAMRCARRDCGKALTDGDFEILVSGDGALYSFCLECAAMPWPMYAAGRKAS